jgi:Ca2+-binding RTX toxin-like protein
LNGFLYLEDIVAKIGDVSTLSTDIRFSGHDNYVDINDLGSLGQINTNANAIGTKGSGSTSSLTIDDGESITLEFLESDGNGATVSSVVKPVDQVTLTFSNTNGSISTPQNITFIVHYAESATPVLVVGSSDSNGQYTIIASEGFSITSIDIVNDGASGAFLVKEVSVSTVTQVIDPEDVQLDFQVEIIDSDTDAASYNFVIGIDGSGNLVGTTGDDVIDGTDSGEIINANSGNDIVDGGIGIDIISGEAGNDILIGGAGADFLIGGADNDILTGGADADTFDFNLADLGTLADVATDTITDFNEVDGDVIDLSDILVAGSNNTIAGIENDGHLQIQVTNSTAGGVIQTIDVNSIVVGDNAAAQAMLTSLIGSGAIDDVV